MRKPCKFEGKIILAYRIFKKASLQAILKPKHQNEFAGKLISRLRWNQNPEKYLLEYLPGCLMQLKVQEQPHHPLWDNGFRLVTVIF